MAVTKKTIAEEVFQEAQALSDVERERLMLMLAEQTREGLSQAEIEHEWNEEAVRRFQEYRDGKVEAIPAEDVMRRLREKYG